MEETFLEALKHTGVSGQLNCILLFHENNKEVQAGKKCVELFVLLVSKVAICSKDFFHHKKRKSSKYSLLRKPQSITTSPQSSLCLSFLRETFSRISIIYRYN